METAPFARGRFAELEQAGQLAWGASSDGVDPALVSDRPSPAEPSRVLRVPPRWKRSHSSVARCFTSVATCRTVERIGAARSLVRKYVAATPAARARMAPRGP